MRISVPICLLLLTLFVVPVDINPSYADEGTELYTQHVKPLLKAKCWACHGTLKQEASLRLDAGALLIQGGDSGPAAVSGKSAESLLIERIAAKDVDERMPPEGEPLTASQIAVLKKWIDAGAPIPSDEEPQVDPREHWAFQPLKQLENRSIDGYIDAALQSQKLKRSPQADRRTLVRRLFLDMHGLPPTPEQIDAFIQDDRPDAWEQWVETALASPRYGERWAQHWLDIVRYADTHGYEVNTPRENAWPYRNYVIDALNADKPYDRFVYEQLAGDAVGEDAATGFLVAAPVLLPGQIGKDDASKRLARQDSLDEMIIGTSATFLGLTVGCARCHDHKFDPISQADYYAMQAFFAGVDYGERPIRDENYDEQQLELAAVRKEIKERQAAIQSHIPTVYEGHTILIDDEDLERVTILKPKQGHGTNPNGSKRGQKNDPGNATRFGTLSDGRYTWWKHSPGEDVFTYNPNITGTYQIWISWGAHGSGVHSEDARYILDQDGDLKTRDDQTEIANVNQQRFAYQASGKVANQPLWSGLLAAGTHALNRESRIIIRGGETGTGVTADIIVLQEARDKQPQRRIPRLREAVNFLRNTERFGAMEATAVRFTSFATTNNNRYEPCIDELEAFGPADPTKNVALAKHGCVPSSSGNYPPSSRHKLTHVNDGQYGNGRSWISNEKGRGWVQIDFPTPTKIDTIVWGRDRNGKIPDRLAINYEIALRSEDGTWHTVASNGDRVPFGTPDNELNSMLRWHGTESAELAPLTQDLAKLRSRESALSKVRMVYGGRFRQPDITKVLYRGDPEQPLDEIAPHVPSLLGEMELSSATEEQQRREKLAQWITNPSNPLTARVIANRIWQFHFGTGIVRTTSDFGLNGESPSHPELLDWLAAELMEHNWSLKHLHRQILLSKTYQQSNAVNASGDAVDHDCRLLWRFPSRRMEAEAIRDSLLACSGELNLTPGTVGFNFFKSRGGLSGFPPITEFTEAQKRRMVYAHKVRMEPVPVFGAFDCPDAGQPAPKRSQSTTAIQALNLFNSSFILERSNVLSERLMKEHGTVGEQVDGAFRSILGREPSADERNWCNTVAQEYGLNAVCRALFNTSEFLLIP